MDDGLLSLKWNNHKSTFFHILSNLRKKETYTDATLACEGKFFPVHKLVMSTCSDYFSEVFERTTCKSPVVILKDIGYNDLEALLDYMYLGEVDVKQSELAGLIKAAECLRIKGLAVPDEDPSIHKKSTHVPDSRLSPSTKRSRRDSGGSDSSQHFIPSKGSRSHSPLNSSSSSRSHSTSSISSTPVPSHTVTADSLSQVPSHSMPPPIFSAPNASSSLNNNEVLQHQDQIIVPVDMIKVEVEDEGNNNSDIGAHNTPSERRSGGREEPRGEGGGSGDRSMKEPISNNFSEYTHHPGDIEKEEHDQIDYNGSEQLAGPSGVQGAPPIMNWGEEEGTFPHNLFGDDTSHQQVDCVALEDGRHAIRQDDDYSLPFLKGFGSSTLTHFGMDAFWKPHRCPFCEKGFRTSNDLKRHIRIHTGEKPFECPKCPYKASQKQTVKRHLKTVHGKSQILPFYSMLEKWAD